MQVIQTVNDTIRILFNPLEEGFRLLDFLLVQDEKNKFLAQIIEVYDDKYDASQNVARIKLLFRVDSEGEVSGYDHYTPSKECEIRRVKPDEILDFVNEDKKKVTIGLNYKNDEFFEINEDFFRNNCVIFSDKIEQSNSITTHLSEVLSKGEGNCVIFDFSGALELSGAKRLVATKDFKMPLDSNTIEYIWEKGLSGASLETQAMCREIFNEVQDYAKNAPDGFIPFKNFLNVVNIQYKATPIAELSVLLNSLKAYQKNNIFALGKNDFENLTKAVSENKITLIDFSPLKTEWHKEFADFIIRSIKKDSYVFLRLNDANSDVDFISFMYNKNKHIAFIPSISYTYKKMPYIIENVNNYMLLPTLNPRRDFGAANYELASMSDDECLLFGKNTENFLFAIYNNKFEPSKEDEEPQRRTIKLKIEDANSIPVRMNFDGKTFTPVNFEQQVKEDTPQEITEEELDFFDNIQEENFEQEAQIQEESALVQEIRQEVQQELKQEDELLAEDEIVAEDELESQQAFEDVHFEEVKTESASDDIALEEISSEDEIYEDPKAQVLIEEAEDEPTGENLAEQEPETKTVIEEATEQTVIETETVEEETNFEDEVQKVLQKEIEEQDILAQEKQEALVSNEPEELIEESEDDNVSLQKIAAQSIETTFNEVIDDKNVSSEDEPSDSKTLKIEGDVVLTLDGIEDVKTKSNSELPIFRHKKESKETKYDFKTGQIVLHEKYGRGEIIKVIKHSNRPFLQINFEGEAGKRLLDPAIAKIELEEKE